MNPFDLTGKNIIVTGASSGIGRQCAISCSQMGATVALIGRNEERLNETLSQMDNQKVHLIVVLDLTQYEQIKPALLHITDSIGRIDGVLNSAGISDTSPMKAASKEKLAHFMDTNVYSAYMLTKEVCGINFFSKEGGSIVFLSSVMGVVGEKGKSIYGMSKGALISLTNSLACELAVKRIRVNAISPGTIITPINENLPHIADPERRKALEAKHLLGLGNTVDVANAAIYLLSDAAKWVTGTNLIVDGGYIAR